MSDSETIKIPILRQLVLSGARPLVAVVLALLAGAGLIWFRGANPITAYVALLQGAIGSVAGLTNTGVRATPLLIGGLGVAVAFKAGLFNVGTEGHMYVGGAAAAVVGLVPLPVPSWLHVLLALVAGSAAGALWGVLPAYLRAYRNVNEFVTTVMLNEVALLLVSYLVHYTALAAPGATFPMSPPLLASARLPILVKGTSLHAGIILGLVLAGAVHLLLQYTAFGFRTRLVGGNPEAARYAGVDTAKQIIVVFLISSALGGVAGACEVMGLKLRLYNLFVSGVGYEAIAVALVANSNPLAVVLSSFFFGALKAGANRMQIVSGCEASLATVIQALAVMFTIAIGIGERLSLSHRKVSKEPRKHEAPV